MRQGFKKLNNIFAKLFALNKKRLFLGVFVLVSATIFIPIHYSQAIALAGSFILGSVVTGVIVGLVNAGGQIALAGALLGIFIWFCTMLLEYGNAILNWAVTSPFGMSMTNPNGNIMIELGWTLMRDFTNMLFILGLAYIGIATALNMVTFDTKKTFVNLLLIALLINFTPVICGIIVDVSNIVTDFFLSDVDFSDNLRVLNDNFGNKTNIEGLLSKGGAFWGEMAAGIAYSVISGLILLTFGGIFLLRHIMIWILVIFSPLAFFAWIFAKTRKWFDFWWKQFIMWSFIAVPAAFFLYLGTHLVYEIQNSKVIEYNMADPSGGLFSKLVPYLMVIIFLGVGLGATKKLTPIGASVVIGAVGKIKGKGLSLSKKYGKKLGAWSAKTTAGTTAGGMAGAIEGMKQAKEAGGGGGAMLKAAATGLGAGAATRTGREAGRHSFWKNVERIPIIGKPGMAEERRKKRLGMSDAGSRAKNLSSPAIEKQIENFNPLTGNVGNMRSWIQELVNRDDFEYSAEKGGKGEKYINTGKQHGVDFTKLNKSRQDLTIYTKSNKVNANMKTLIDTAGDDYSEDQRAEYRKKAELQLLEGELEKVSKRGGRNISTKTLEDKRIAKLIRDKHGRIYDDIYNQGDKKRKISLQKGFHKLLKDENNFEKDGTTIKPTKEKYVNETKDLLNRLNIELNMPGDNEEDEADDEEERESTLITENLEEEFRNAKKGQ